MLDSCCGHDLLGEKLAAQRNIATRMADRPHMLTGVGGADLSDYFGDKVNVSELGLHIDLFVVRRNFQGTSVGKYC